MLRPLIAAVLLAAFATPAAALEPLAQNAHVTDRLVQARVADVLRRNCPSIDARMVRAFREARGLKRHALNQGYSEAQINAFLDDRQERRRIYAQGDRYLRSQGVVDGQPDSFCRLGRDEIAPQTVAGSLLGAR